jgi:N-acetylmuramoyl-L-alanine amidase
MEPRRNGRRPTILLLHYTGMMDAGRAIDWLARPESRVSCHYVVDEAGRITQMVSEEMRAWHAGVSFWAGERDINSASIGIEIHNPGRELGYPDFPAVQIAAVTALGRDIVTRHAIVPQKVLAHSDVSPERKTDPGEKFPWHSLAAAGVGHWIVPAPVDPADEGLAEGACGPMVKVVQAQLAAYGYEIAETGVLDRRTVFVLRAFQLHFRQGRVDCRLDRSTAGTLSALIAAQPKPSTS